MAQITHNFFNPVEFRNRIGLAADFIIDRLPRGFLPYAVITLGSGGLGDVAQAIEQVADPIPYDVIPGYNPPTVADHKGLLISGHLAGVPVIAQQGRNHFYEKGAQPNTVIAMKDVTFPVYVAHRLGAKLYMATNAAGGLNPASNPGDVMMIRAHLALFVPNPLLGPQVYPETTERFPPQHTQYSPQIRKLMRKAAEELGVSDRVHEGVYAAVTGPSYEAGPDSQALRVLGADAVGMSTVVEVITADMLGMQTFAYSLISNVIAADGTNKTSHTDVGKTLSDPATRARTMNLTKLTFVLIRKELK